MPNNKSDRAKIFLPFDSLKGFRAALKEREEIIIPQKELLEDSINEINTQLANLKNGSFIKVTYYDHKHQRYQFIEGPVTNIITNSLQIIKTTIFIQDIKSIEIKEKI